MPFRSHYVAAVLTNPAITPTSHTRHRPLHVLTNLVQRDKAQRLNSASSTHPQQPQPAPEGSPIHLSSPGLPPLEEYQRRHSMPFSSPPIQRLFSANAQWADGMKEKEPAFFDHSAKGQSPKLLWIGCADSRVPETVVMAAKPGDIFVHRNIANQFHLNDDSALSVLTYAVKNLGVQDVAVVGHTKCGGAAACLAAACRPADPPGPGSDVPLKRWLTPMTKLARDLNLPNVEEDVALPLLIEENVKVQVANVVASDVIQDWWRAGQNVTVHGWVYEIEKGQIRDLEISVSGPSES